MGIYLLKQRRELPRRRKRAKASAKDIAAELERSKEIVEYIIWERNGKPKAAAARARSIKRRHGKAVCSCDVCEARRRSVLATLAWVVGERPVIDIWEDVEP